jgi:hypothetical protein
MIPRGVYSSPPGRNITLPASFVLAISERREDGESAWWLTSTSITRRAIVRPRVRLDGFAREALSFQLQAVRIPERTATKLSGIVASVAGYASEHAPVAR